MLKLKKTQKSFKALFLILGVTFFVQTAHGGAVSKVLDLLVNESGIIELLSGKGIRGSGAHQLKYSALNSLKNLNPSGEVPDAEQLKIILQNLDTSGKGDLAKKRKINKILKMPHHKITNNELRDLFNDLIFLSDRYGHFQATALACSQCVSNSLYSRGFKYTLELLDDSSSIKIMKHHLPKSPKRMKKYIAREMSKAKLGNFSRASVGQVGREEEKALGLFLAMAKHGSSKKKAFANAVKEISRDPSGKIKLIDPENPHKLWKIFSSKLTDKQLDSWTDILKETVSKSKGMQSKKAAFYSVLEAKASGHAGMKKRIEVLKKNKCYFQ